MSYIKGEVEVTENYRSGELEIQLPHSCDEWIIGGVKEAEQMIFDLQEAIQKLKSQSK